MMGSDQMYIHPCEDPFAWYDHAAAQVRMILHTFRMGMLCGAGTKVPCGGGAALNGGEPTGAFATSAAASTAADGVPTNLGAFFNGWQYHEDALAYNWSIPTPSANGDHDTPSANGNYEVLRRRERPWLLFDDDGKVYLFTCASPSNTSIQMYTHAQEVALPAGLGPPPVFPQ
jgi:hypothetical protein